MIVLAGSDRGDQGLPVNAHGNTLRIGRETDPAGHGGPIQIDYVERGLRVAGDVQESAVRGHSSGQRLSTGGDGSQDRTLRDGIDLDPVEVAIDQVHEALMQAQRSRHLPANIFEVRLAALKP